MQIRQTGQPIPVSKVETDRREEVKKIKPIGTNQIPDSFENPGSKQASAESSNSSSAEPEMKAGQNTGRILIDQLTQARLAESGIRVSNEKENKGKKDLSGTQQDQTENTSPEVNTKGNPHTPGTTTDYGARVPDGAYTGDARSNMEKNKGALEDFFTQNNIDVPSSGNGVDASDFGVGQGVDLGNGFNTGQTGPGDPMAGINDKFARMDYLNGVGNAGNRLNSQLQDAAKGADGAGIGHGKDMVAETIAGELRDLGRLAGEVADDMVKSDRLEKELEWQEKYAKEMDKKAEEVHARSERIKTLERQIDNAKNLGMSPIGYAGQQKELEKLKKEQAAEVKRPAGNSGSGTGGGTKTASDTTQENYDRGKVKQADELLKNLGMDGIWNLQRGPKNQGKGPDYGPEPVGTSVEDAGNGSLSSQFGKDGLVGNPNQQNHAGPGNSNFGGLPDETVTDPIEGETYHGAKRDAEVDPSLQTGMEENVYDDDEEKRKLIKNPDVKLARNVPHSKKF